MSDLPPPSPLLAIEREHHGIALVVRVKGEIDLSTAPEVERHVQDALDSLVPPAPLVLDLSEVAFLGSCGLALLASSTERAAARGTPLRVVARQRAISRPVEAVGLDDTLVLHPSLEAALRADEEAPGGR
ncbi:anti-anti-sigma factor [Prauserella shujinwangii]|uniref:Anti-sigma factor antagonist n=1 Tax=Prauserella shujinwangii TaxID=1453103 RepID=A0A2T0LX48_9PSEU|nr:anti-sigma factor antagonist [Prauserella shujinwangii]PRX48594.1 anti-anti-sigma factor [Prauserella shujinwangii]